MAHSSPSPDSNAQHETQDLDRILKLLGPALIGILAVSLLFFWRSGEDSEVRTEVSQAYTAASTAEELEGIAEAYPDQPEAPLALLQSAAERFTAREFETAEASYQSFLSKYPKHPLREYAEWGMWMTQEQLDQLDSALNGFTSVTPEDLLYPQALLARARILEKQEKASEAIELYAQVQEEFPESPWAQQADIFSQQASLSLAQ